LALPTEWEHFGDINGLGPSLGKCRPIEAQWVFPESPKPVDPPQRRTAALVGTQDGGKDNRKVGGTSKGQHYYTNRLTATAPRIVALHWGAE
jgi:hypothetical protein